eukprot:13245317-Alexandrium_andersonii.AAC.1
MEGACRGKGWLGAAADRLARVTMDEARSCEGVRSAIGWAARLGMQSLRMLALESTCHELQELPEAQRAAAGPDLLPHLQAQAL